MDLKGGGAQWVLPASRYRLRAETDRFLETNQIKGHVVLESDVILSLTRSVVDEIGIALLPLIYIAREIRGGTLQTIGPKLGYWQYRVWLSCHIQSRNDVLIRGLARAFKEVCKQS